MKSIRTYTVGFVLSVGLTLVAFGLVWWHLKTEHVFPTHDLAIPVLVGLALVQLLVQLVFFLHLGQEKAPWWNTIAFAFAVFVVAVVVGGSLWIMEHLEHNMSAISEVYEGGVISPQTQDD